MKREGRGLDKKTDASILRWFVYIEKWGMRGLLRGCILEGVRSRLGGSPQKRLIDSVKFCLRKRSLNVGQARIMVHDMND